jgi:hypothetical protein
MKKNFKKLKVDQIEKILNILEKVVKLWPVLMGVVHFLISIIPVIWIKIEELNSLWI